MLSNRVRSGAAALVGSLLVMGCTSQIAGLGSQGPGVAAVLSVERFLQASQQRDLEGMARLFGTAEGSILRERGNTFSCMFKRMGSWIALGTRCLTAQQIELRMDAISQILRHDDYEVASEARVAGRTDPTSRIGVDITLTTRVVEDVGFTMVQTGNGRWIVQEIELQKIAGR